MNASLNKRAVQCLDAKIGIVSNNGDLIRQERYFESARVESLLTNVRQYKEIPYDNVDTEFIVLDDPSLRPYVSICKESCCCLGDFSTWEKECGDSRYGLFGNLGLFFRYTLTTLERHHGIYSFHAGSIYIPDHNLLLLVMGGPGAGKSVYLLRSILDGWKIFSTEMTHFRIGEKGIEFFKGSLFDNVRLGSLIHDFPEVIDKLGLKIPNIKNEWEEQTTIDLSAFQADDVYRNPRIQIINVRIESDRKKADVSVMKDKEIIVRTLYKNACEKFISPWLMYGRLPVAGCDDELLAQKRLKTMYGFYEKADLLPVKSVLSGVKNCMDGILE
jgi:hypothetical protein